jgi:hypothetical protein
MRKETIKYVDYNGKERCEDFYFNLNKAEIIEMQVEAGGDMEGKLKKIIDTEDLPRLHQLFKDIILKSYGVKSEDGRRFIKSKEASAEFAQTEAYAELVMMLMSDGEKAAEFINGVIPNINR